MARGFIRGVLWGAGISLGAVTLVSVAGDGPKPVDWQGRPATEVANTDETPSQTKGSTGNRVALTGAEQHMKNGPLPDTLVDVAAAAFDTAQVPETGLVSDLQKTELPQASANDGLAATDTTAPTVMATVQPALTTPATEPDVSIATEPAQPKAPDADQQQTAFAEAGPEATSGAENVTAAAVERTGEAEAAPAPVVSDSVADLAQPVLPEASDPAGSLVEPSTPSDASSTTQVADAAPVVQDNVPEVDASDAAAGDPQGEVDVAQAPVATDNTQEMVVEIAASEPQLPEIDAPQPQATTELALALTDTQERPASRLPQISTEQQAPEVSGVSDLDAPARTDDARKAGDSSPASVTASVVLDTVVSAPQPKTEPAAIPAGFEQEAPQIAQAPDVLQSTAPDPVATVDLTLIAPIPTSETTEEAVRPVREVKVNRLPTVGAALAPVPDTQQTEQVASLDPDSLSLDLDVKPVKKYAQPFENPDSKPVMAIVLMDEGAAQDGAAIGLPALKQLPYPVSFAVDTRLPDAAERMQAYRREGFEVLAMINLPEGATATDAEVNLSVALERMPEVVGVLEGLDTGVQTTRDSGRQVAQILAQTGHGFVTQNKGLNTVQKLAARQGVPSAVVFRDFDAQGQSERVIGRFLDQAAFRAGQEGGVVMLGRLREETIAALLVWALQDRAAQLALAPVTGALRAQEP